MSCVLYNILGMIYSTLYAYTIYISLPCVFRHLTPKEYDLEITRCIQSNVVRQQQQEQDFLDEHQDHLKQQQLPQLQPRLQQQLPCQTQGNSDPMTLNMNSETGEVQHPYLRTNENNSSNHFCQSACEQGGSWENNAQNNPPGSYVDFLGPQSVSVKRSRFDQGMLSRMSPFETEYFPRRIYIKNDYYF